MKKDKNEEDCDGRQDYEGKRENEKQKQSSEFSCFSRALPVPVRSRENPRMSAYVFPVLFSRPSCMCKTFTMSFLREFRTMHTTHSQRVTLCDDEDLSTFSVLSVKLQKYKLLCIYILKFP